ncbi:MAG: hypothetical protein ACFFBZ_04865 [Promethearchaeota archaeon]
MDLEDIIALEKIFNLVKEFFEKNIIRKSRVNYSKIKKNIKQLKSLEGKYNQEAFNLFKKTLKKLKRLVNRELLLPIYYIFGAHGGVIINDIGFCEFDSPNYALDNLLRKMRLSIKTNQPYNLEIAICCLEWLRNNYYDKFSEFLKLYEPGKHEIINPTYSQPYSLIIGAESNIKQFEFGIKVLGELGLESNIFYSSESSLHPQIPQILKGFNIKYSSLRTRLLGINPTSASAYIDWIGLDNTFIDAIINQSGIFNGEYWHGAFFQEIPNLLFQAISFPFFDYILYSSIEDFVNPHPYQEDVWRISRFSEIFGKFLLSTDFFKKVEKEGEFKYQRDDFKIADHIFAYSELFLQNKNSEISILTAEVINSILGFYNKNSNDVFFNEIWKKLLITQAHDCYAVPFIRTGDYSQLQLNKEILKEFDLKESNCTISELCIQIHKEIQNKIDNFIRSSLIDLCEILGKNKKKETDSFDNILVFNPNPYPRRDIISIQSNFETPLNNFLIRDGKKINYQLKDSKLKFIADVPGFGYKIYKFTGQNNKGLMAEPSSSFLYELKISDDLETIEVKFKKITVYKLKFQSKYRYKLHLNEKFIGNIESKYIIRGTSKAKAFHLEIIQYNGVNRLEFLLDSNSLESVILMPKLKIKKTIRNYPFGIEETKKSKIQTLDFIWLKGINQGIIYIQKNSQKFIINRKTFEIQNLIKSKGIYEFAISITEENNSNPLLYVNSFYFKLLGISHDKDIEIAKLDDEFITIEPPISVINLWRRKDGIYLRLFNPTNEELHIKLKSKHILNQLIELDLNYNQISILEPDKLKIGPWKIKTFRFGIETKEKINSTNY